MFTVYLLYSQKFNKIYVGYTSNLEERLISHNKKSNMGYTLKYRPWDVVYTEKVEEKSEAIKREKQLKSSKGRELCWQKVQEKFQTSI